MITIKNSKQLPIGLFGLVAAVSSMSIAWRVAHYLYDYPLWISDTFGIIAEIIFVFLFIIYLIKILFSFNEIKKELSDRRNLNLLSLVAVSLMLLSAILLISYPQFASYCWYAGAILMVVLIIVMMQGHFGNKNHSNGFTADQMLPVIGLISIPFIGYSFPLHAVALVTGLSISGGLLMAITFFTLIFHSYFFADGNKSRTEGSPIMLAAPFAMGYLSLMRTMESGNEFANILYYAGLFIFLIFSPKVFNLIRMNPWETSWWSVAFPISIVSIAALKKAGDEEILIRLNYQVATSLLLVATIVTMFVFIHSVIFIFLRKKDSGF